MKQLEIWKFILKSFSDNIPVMLLYVLESSGSSPGRQGFFMAVNANKEMEGSVGGGIMEHKFVEMAKQKLQTPNFREAMSDKPEVKKQIHNKSSGKDQSGMICSGEQIIFLYHIQEKDISYIKKIISSLKKKRNGTLSLSSKGISFNDLSPENDFNFTFENKYNWSYEEKTGRKNHLFIIGGGHCSLALSKIMYDMGFYIHVFDNRKHLKTMHQNNSTNEKKIVKSYSELKEIIPSGKNNYVVVMTQGYRTDDITVRCLMNKDFRYFGLLGSKKKIEKLFTTYHQEGIARKVVKKIHAPIGIQIKSETPEEIAVSIAAGIIKAKNFNR